MGQLAHGTTNATLLEDTRRIVLNALDYLDERNLAILREAQCTAAASNTTSDIMDAELLADIKRFDFDTAKYVPRSLAPTSIIPAVLDGKEPGSVELDYFFMVHALTFPPSSPAVTGGSENIPGAGEAAEERTFASLPAAVAAKLKSAKDTVRSIPPKDAILHASMDNKDWIALAEGAPLFQSLSGAWLYT